MTLTSTPQTAGPGDQRSFEQLQFLGLDFADVTYEETEAAVLQWALDSRFRYVITPNVDHIVRLNADVAPGALDDLWAAYHAADLRVCDSRVLAHLASLSGINLPVVVGADLTVRLLSRRLAAGTKIAIIGGDERQLAQLRQLQPHLDWHLLVPPMGVRTNPEAQAVIVRFIEETGAALVFFAIGSPQSEIVAWQVSKRGIAPGVGLCIGASIEFLTGDKKRAPQIVQALSLEWAFRLFSEPRRLWRRYLVEGPRIFAIWRKWNKNRVSEA
jgi:N-acetylglucosaminyldiphosphoundecaprenol N-acetyl-beta-D-mannosaminyltransferase